MPRRSTRIRSRIPRPNRQRHVRRVTNLRLQGIAAALAIVAREHREPDFAMMVLTDMQLSLADLKAAGADPYDLEPLEAASPDFRR